MLLEPFFSTVRIVMLTASLIFLQKFTYFQVFISNFFVTFVIIFTGYIEPFKGKSISFFEIFNEVFISIMNYHLLCFTDIVTLQSTRNLLGWSIIGCITFNLLVNMSFIMFNAIKDAYLEYRLKYYQYKLKMLLKAKLKR